MQIPVHHSSHAGRTAILTGAAGGIGRTLAQRGARVILVDRSAAVTDAARDLAAEGVDVCAWELDVRDEAGVRELIAAAQREWGGPDILVNNAAIHPKNEGERQGAAAIATAQWDEVLVVNLTAVFVLCREVLPGMQARGWGRSARSQPLICWGDQFCANRLATARCSFGFAASTQALGRLARLQACVSASAPR